MTDSMWALASGRDGRLEMVQATRPQRGAGQVLVRVTAAGFANSWALWRGEAGQTGVTDPPAGMALVSVVQEAQPGSSTIVGGSVAIMPAAACGQCPDCVAGNPRACTDPILAGFEHPVVLGEMLAVPDTNIVPLAPGRLAHEATLLGRAAEVLSLVRQAHVQIGESVALFGISPEMVIAAQWVRIAGAYDVYLVDQDPGGLALARKLWLGECIGQAGDDAVSRIRDLRHGKAVDLAVVQQDDQAGMQMALNVLVPDGRVLVVSQPPAGGARATDSHATPFPVIAAGNTSPGLGSLSRFDWEVAARTWGSGRLALRDLIAAIVPAQQLVAGVQAAESLPGSWVVALLGERHQVASRAQDSL